MKNNILLSLLVIVAVVGLISCEEIGPVIDFTETDPNLKDTAYTVSTTATPDVKKILLEEATGFNCVNCPSGHEKGKELETAYPDRVIIVGLDDYELDPHPLGREDYRTQAAKTILNDIIGGVGGYPSGAIDRTHFSGETQIALGRFGWAGHAPTRLALTPKCNISIVPDYDATTKKLVVNVRVEYTDTPDETQNLSVALVENNIVDYQNNGLTGESNDEDYVNNHILRTMLSPVGGSPLNYTAAAPMVVYEKAFSVTVEDNWNPDELAAVAFVHNTVANKEVEQVEEIHIN